MHIKKAFTPHHKRHTILFRILVYKILHCSLQLIGWNFVLGAYFIQESNRLWSESKVLPLEHLIVLL
jgi:hypothetical protein